MESNTAPTLRYEICMAGDIDHAKQIIREFVYDVGLCVTVEPTTFVYTGGEEAGFRVGFINYPRFPTTEETLVSTVMTLAKLLRGRLCQKSYTVIGPERTLWYREKD